MSEEEQLVRDLAEKLQQQSIHFQQLAERSNYDINITRMNEKAVAYWDAAQLASTVADSIADLKGVQP